MNAEWLKILELVRSGDLSAAEGARRLDAFEEASQVEVISPPLPEAESTLDAETEASIRRWKSWWQIPFWAGAGIFLLSATLMAWAYPAAHFFWFYCSILPLLFGLLVLLTAAWSCQARWLHLRVRESGARKSNVSISMPLPTRLAGWALRLAGPFIPKEKLPNFDLQTLVPLIDSLHQSREPVIVEVNDDSSHVQIYIL